MMAPPQAANVVVVGSINMDLVARCEHVPAPGETVLGNDFQTIPGGKGANQAVAVARLGAACTMVGRVGQDDFGRRLLAGLAAESINTRYVPSTPETATGVALIVVSASGQNAICVAGGANFAVTPADIDAAEDAIARADVCLLQMEVPISTVIHTLGVCRRHGVRTILDPAPAPAEPPENLFGADVISPNESEARILLGRPDIELEPQAVAEALSRRGVAEVVLKLGERGAAILSKDEFELVPGHRVNVVDTTAAGDAFTAALAVARASGKSLRQAVHFANAAGALACTTFGAQPSMPTAEEVAQLA